jgi:hypothetical protein
MNSAPDRNGSGRRTRRRAVLSLIAGMTALAACTAGDVLMPPADVGGTVPAAMQGAVLDRSYGYVMPVVPDPVPEEEVACRSRLRRLGVTFTDLAPIEGSGGCGIAHPVQVTGLPRGVRLKPAATLNCHMAEALALWTRDELVPSARLRYFSGVDTIHQGSSYSCRTIGNRRGGTLSEHGRGNAIDIMKITLNSGREIDIRKPGLFSFRKRGLLNSVRGDACDYFSTVLGPGYDRAHRDHFHFDLMTRRGGRKACR